MRRRAKSDRRLNRRPLVGIEQLESREVPAVAFALSGSNLLSFDTASPTITQTTAITNVAAGETLVGIDFRPQNGLLYGLGVNSAADTATVYTISIRTGSVTPVGTAGGVTGAGDLPDPAVVGYGVDFNPTVDRIRVVAGSLNFRVNPNTGTLAGSDTAIGGGTTTVDATAYTNNAPNATATTQYTLDASSDSLFIQNPPNAGTQNLVASVKLGGSALDFSAINGFDIPAGVNTAASGTPVAAGSAFAVLNVGGATGLYGISLVDGTATLVGNVGTGATAVQGLAVQNDLGGLPAVALDSTGTNLLRFNTATPGTVTTQAIGTGGLVAGETLVGIDFRPATGQLYGLGIDATAETGTLYLIDPQTGAVAIAVAGTGSAIAYDTTDFPAASVGYGIDFNPDVDRIRATTGTGLNFRINPNTGLPVDGNSGVGGTQRDGDINGSGVTGVTATAYTNAFGNDVAVTATTQYTLDATTDSLYIQNPPNNGTQTNPLPITLGGAPLDFTEINGFDIPAGVRVAASASPVTSGFGYAALVVSGTTGIYRIDLSTGAATLLGSGPFSIAGLTLADAPAGTVAFAGAAISQSETGPVATVNLTRTGSSNGAVTVTVNVTGGTASAGLDFTAGPYTATFADGATTASFTIALVDDLIFEGNETIILTIASANNAAAIGSPNVATVTITENDPQQTFTVNVATGYALSGSNLIPIASTNPGAAGAPIAVVGVDANETLVGIDFRPQNGQLYGLGVNATANTATLYAVSPITGNATPLGSVGAIAFVDGGGNPIDLPDPATVNYDIDINPAVDRLRIVAGSLNFRVDPNSGNPVDGNAGLAGTNTDGAINGATTTVGGTAYTNAFPNNGGVTTQYTLDAATDSLFIQNPPNNGTQTSGKSITLGGSPLDFTAVRGFDILANVNAPASSAAVAAGSGLAVLTVGGADGLYSIDLVTGAATFVGTIGATPATVNGVAFQSDLGATPTIGLNATGTALVRSLSNNVANPFTVSIAGITAGETLAAIDFRPQTGQLFGLGINGTTDTGSVYRIDPQTGAATVIGTAGSVAFFQADGTTPVDLPDASAGYGMDFNPTVDRIRVVTSTGLNFRLNPNNGAAVDGNAGTPGTNTDGAINGGATGVSATAYTNSFGQSLTGGATTQYTLDATSDSLYIQNPPNSGTQTLPLPITLGGSPLDFTDVNGFNIPSNVRVSTSNTPVASGTAFASLTVGGVPGLYAIDLATGTASLLGTAPAAITGLTTANTPTGVVEFSSAAFSATESGTTLDLTLVRTGGSAGALTVTVNLTPGTAAAGDDFDATAIAVTFADGQTTATASVPLVDETIFEADETFTAALAGATNGGVVGAISSATVTIANDDPLPAIAISNAQIVEGNAGTTQLAFTVTLTNPSSQTITVSADTTDGTAAAGTDYTALVGSTVTFAPGETTQTVLVDIAGETTFEADETFTVTLSNPANATIATGTATGTITNDDTAPTVSIDSVSQAEGNAGTTAFTFTVSLSAASGLPASVTVDTADGTAIAGKDYAAAVGTVLTFAPGETTKTVTVNVAGETINEADETFTVVLSSPSGATIGTGTGTGTIANDDAAPVLSINNVSVTEGNVGVTAVTFTVSLVGATEQTVTVDVASADGTALAPGDYAVLASQTLTFAPGETNKTVTVNVVGDSNFEPDETFFAQLSSPTNATLGQAKGTGTIVNDDSGPLQVGVPDAAIGSASAPPVVRVVDAAGKQVSLTALSAAFNGGVRTAAGDVDGDGIADVVVGNGPGAASLVRVLSGKDGSELFSTAPFEATFTGGVFVAVGDVNGDGQADIAISPDRGGGPRIRIVAGGTFTQIADFFGIADSAFRGGVRTAIGDVNGDGTGDVVVAAGLTGGPRVSAIDGTTLTTTRATLFNDFFAFEQTLRDGAFIAVGDVNGDGFADIVAGGGPSGGPRISIFDAQTLISSKGATLLQLANFFAGDPNLRTGVLVAVKDLDGDNLADIRTVVGGSDTILSYLGSDLTPTATNPPSTSLDGLDGFNGGVFVG